ncbi:hypothetical protein BV22DRAFT_1051974 [Leucogyrophana mollusca]|uniref:Uncharacterized protein n=1 Tax=Leucogyrophana mollusca TaxID=85980 RepID=A0ACB8AX37_9AGAM|nr:hypothetical protein BV22DRAFT_1051974 [Leucogyrophana mollusca]
MAVSIVLKNSHKWAALSTGTSGPDGPEIGCAYTANTANTALDQGSAHQCTLQSAESAEPTVHTSAHQRECKHEAHQTKLQDVLDKDFTTTAQNAKDVAATIEERDTAAKMRATRISSADEAHIRVLADHYDRITELNEAKCLAEERMKPAEDQLAKRQVEIAASQADLVAQHTRAQAELQQLKSTGEFLDLPWFLLSLRCPEGR